MEPRKNLLTIREWTRVIGKNRYKFIITHHPKGQRSYQVFERREHSWLQIHLWRIDSEGQMRGIYTRSTKKRS